MEQRSAPHTTVGVVDGENLLFHQSWLNQMPLIFLAVFLEVVIVYLTIAYPDFALFVVPLGSDSFSASILPVFPLFVLLWGAIRIYNERLVVTPFYLIHVSGRIQWRERSVRLEYSHIQEIETVQSIFQRFLGIGDLMVVPIGSGNRSPIMMKGLRHPRAVKDVIREIKAKHPQVHSLA